MTLHLQKPVNFPDIQGPREDRVIMLFGCLFIVVSTEVLAKLLFKNIIRVNKNLAVKNNYCTCLQPNFTLKLVYHKIQYILGTSL